jgi:molybdenum ABC transporter molybdate-binding protein
MAIGPPDPPRGGQQGAPGLDLEEQLEPAVADDEPAVALQPHLRPQLQGRHWARPRILTRPAGATSVALRGHPTGRPTRSHGATLPRAVGPRPDRGPRGGHRRRARCRRDREFATGAPALTVFAAADLVFVLGEIAATFERIYDTKVILVFGSTGHLAPQIAHGAPADVFFAANERFVDDLVRRGAIVAATRTLYAQGRIVLATRKDRGPQLTDLRQLTAPGVRRIAIANPRHAPYGLAAEEALRAAGIWEVVESKLVFGENIRHTLQFLETGGVEAAIVALSVATAPGSSGC